MISSPCKDCEERHTLCWSECERYKAMKNEYEALKAYRRDGVDVRHFLIQNARKTKKRLRVK